MVALPDKQGDRVYPMLFLERESGTNEPVLKCLQIIFNCESRRLSAGILNEAVHRCIYGCFYVNVWRFCLYYIRIGDVV